VKFRLPGAFPRLRREERERGPHKKSEMRRTFNPRHQPDVRPGTGEVGLRSAEEAISNPLMDDLSLRGARGVLNSITGGKDLTLYEVDEAQHRKPVAAAFVVGDLGDEPRADR
jgi:hypothetical protein